jgi:threonine aldolase
MTYLDFRSDTVTKPTPAMRKAMYEAEVGDDVFGDDPTVNRLQERVAEILGKEKALYVPSGTMANQIAIHCHTTPGDEVYCHIGAHVLNYEGGAAAMLSGVMFSAIENPRGAFTASEVEARLRGTDHHFPPSRLIWVENSHNRAGGPIFPQGNAIELRSLANRTGLMMHLDGARLWNVAVASGKTEKELAAPFDTVSCCLSKGLGCPVGSLIAGTPEFIDKAHRARKRFGGGMRQAGILAAAGLYALDHHRERLAEDHRHARRIAEAVAEMRSFKIDLDGVQTNIVIFDAAPLKGVDVAAKLKAEGLLVTSFGTRVRMVCHLDVDEAAVEKAIKILQKHFGK